MLVQHFLETAAAQHPHKTALICGKQRMPYEQINELSNRLARSLVELGLPRGGRVAILLDNSVEAVVSLFATLKAGGIFIVLNPTLKSRKLGFILKDSGARAVIARIRNAHTLREAISGTPVQHVIWVDERPSEPPAMTVPELGYAWHDLVSAERKNPVSSPRAVDVDLAAIIYTSGTTGDPKGVMAAHYNMVAVSRSVIEYLNNTSDDIILNPLPLSYGYGLYQVLTAFLVGATVVLEPSFAFPYRLMERAVQEKVTGIPLVPTMAAALLQMTDFPKFDLCRLRYITTAAAALPVAHVRRLMEILPHVSIVSMYGLTECQRVSYLPPEIMAQRPGCVGKAIPNCEVFVLDEEGRELNPGQVGELVVRGSNVMQGYWNAPEETAKFFRPGRYRAETLLYTGDLFRKDEEGYLYFVARKDDIIKTRGERVSPQEIENRVCEMKGVVESAVIGVPDDLLGQAIKLYVSGDSAQRLTEDSILNYCKRHLEAFMVPKYIEIRYSLPKSSSGKIDKKQLISS
jgi:amino acid adenylation domain-containing protein